MLGLGMEWFIANQLRDGYAYTASTYTFPRRSFETSGAIRRERAL